MIAFVLSSAASAATPALVGAKPARAVVDLLQAKLQDVMERGSQLSQAERVSALESTLAECFDGPWMARATLGGYFKNLDDAQRALWIDVFQRFHVSALAETWREQRGERFVADGVREGGRDTVIVRTRVVHPHRGVEIVFDYRLAQTQAGYRIIDVLSPPTVSEVAMRRAEYLSFLQSHSFDELVERMEDQIKARDKD